jgi:nucleoporin NUP159
MLKLCNWWAAGLVAELQKQCQRLVRSLVPQRLPFLTYPSVSWSPKGKQLAIGLQSGDIVTFDPSTPFTPKAIFPHPPTSNPQTIISATWLTNSSFHTIYMPMHVDGPDIELLHYVLSLDSKSKISSTTKLVPPCLPFPGLRPPSAFSLVLRNWNPAKFLILIGDSASSDIGAITCTVNTDNSNEEWRNLSLDETTQPTMPLDKNTADTVLVGLELDLTSTEPVSHTDASGAETDAHISPIMYAYASDGTVLGWHLINPQGGLYPGMPSASASPNASNLGGALTTPETTSDAIMMSRAPSAYGDPMATSTPTTSTPTTSAPSGFGFGAQQFGRPAGFGLLQASSPVSAFSSQTGAQPTFGQTSTFGQSTAPALASQPSTTGPGAFAGFASSAPTKFGQPSFGFGSSLPPSSSQQQQSDEMMSDSPSGFGTMSLGESGDAKSTSGFGGRAGIFGPISQTPPQPSNEAAPSSNAFGVIKPATGFGAFANLPRQQPQPTQSEQSTTAAASSAFGKSGFGAASFDKPGFGTTAPAFGKSSFGGAVTSAPASSLTSGGFGAFAQGGPTSFLSAAGPITGKPAWSTGADAGTTAFGGTVASNSFAAGGVRDNTSGSANTFGGKAGTFSSPTAVTAFDSPRTNAPGTSVFDRQPAAANEGSSLSSRMPQSASSTQPFAVNASPSSPPSSPTLPSGPAAAPQPTSPAPASLTGPKSTATSSPFLKPAVGFGAFRTADATKSSSPFFNPPANIGSIAIPTFASGGDLSKLAPAKVDTAAPKFGATSTLGGASTGAFGSPSALGVGAKSAAPISGGFMAFSGTSTGGFGAFAGPKKSFGELLKSGDHDTKTSEKPKATEGAAPTVEEVQDRAKTSNASDSPQRSQTQRDSIAKSQSDPDVAKDGASKPVFSDTPATATSTSSDDKLHPVPDQASPIFQPSSSNVPRASKLDEDSDSEDGGSGRIERVSEEKVVSLESATRAPVSEAPSLASLSLSSLGSSFVDVPGGEQVTGDTEVSEDGSEREEEEGGEVEEVEEEAEEDEEDEDEEDEAEGTPSSPSPTSTSESEAASGDEDQAHSEEKDSTDGIPDALEPLKIPLPETPKPRSPSTTPKPEFRAVKMAPAPDRPNESLQAGSSRDSSTTPPGTPMKSLPQPPTKSPISSPTPAAPSSASLSGIGLGRPSSRPSRSSPLALTPVPLLDGLDDEKTVVKSTPPPSITPSIFVSAPIAKPAFPPKLDATKVTPHHKPASPHSTPTLQSAHAPFERSSILTPGRSSTPPSKPPASLPFTLGMPPDSMAPPPTLPQTRGIPLSVPHAPPSGVSPARPLQPQPGMAPSVPLKEPSREEGMQAECVYLLSILGKELEQVLTLLSLV